jgi:hypothetical protein
MMDVQLTGANTGDFSFAGSTCEGNTVAAGGTCTVDYKFLPQSLGAKTASVSVTADGSTTTTTLSGTSVQIGGGVLSVSPAMLSFADQAVGSTSSSQTFTVTNTGTVTTAAVSVQIGGANPAAYSAVHNCSTLAPGASCMVSVMFAPTATGLQQATVTPAATGATADTVSVQGHGI